jgi:gluconate 2-dehydrogenase gamma chain
MTHDGKRPRGESDSDETEPVPANGRRISRSRLLKVGAAGAAGVAAGGALAARTDAKDNPVTTPAPLKFLTKWEFDYVTAMAETIWPTDELGPGARVAGVGYYIDLQLAGGWGQGHRFYMNGPFFVPADSGHGWQIPMGPSEIYRAFLPAYDAYVRQTYGKPYTELNADTQFKAMNDLRTGVARIPLAGSTAFATTDFYNLFRQNVLEGMLADPSYGGNRNMVGWKWIGYPGDPMRRGDPYRAYIFKPDKPYPFERKPLPMKPHNPKGTAITGSQKKRSTQMHMNHGEGS